MTIYTSYYKGEIKGEAVSISLYPPPNWSGKHLLLFAPTPELLAWWKSSTKNAAAQQEYKRRFREILNSRQQLIQVWIEEQKSNQVDITLCCFEKTGDFCHRHQVGEEIIQHYLPQMWGGEIGADRQQPKTIQNEKVKHPVTYGPVVLSLIEKCYQLGYPVVCSRLPCGYYQVFLHDEDLGIWSELGVKGLLSGLQHEFYRLRLIPSLANSATTHKAVPERITKSVEVFQETVSQKPSQQNVFNRLDKLSGEELRQIQDWCKSIENQMFSSVSNYA